MKNPLALGIILVACAVFGCTPGTKQENSNDQQSEAHREIHHLHTEYVEGWKAMDEKRIMNLIEGNAMIQPNRLTPIEGKENIRTFWFPDDSSTTVINKFDTEIISLDFRDTLAIMTHKSYLDWDYKKDTSTFGMIQIGINTTVYRKQEDHGWKIWRSMWTDLFTQSK